MTTEAPETRFTRSEGRSIAFQVCGETGPDLVFTPGSFNHVDVWWEHPVTAGFLRSLASIGRLILFDRRGTGASDPLPSDELPSWNDWLADLRAVLDAAGSERAAVFACLDGGPTALSLAAEDPGRVTKLVLFSTTARFRIAEDYPCGVGNAATEAIIEALKNSWGTDAFSAANYPDRADDPDFLRWYAKYQRASIGRGRVEAIARAWFDIDARSIVGRIRTPTLVVQRDRHRMIPESHGRWLAEHLRDSSLVTLPGESALFARDASAILDHVAKFLTGKPLGARLEVKPTGPAVRVRGYELLRRVGRGGMGEVWEARHESSRVRVAIKLIRVSATDELRRRLLREAKAMSAVRHPAVVGILEVTEASDGSPAIAMELLEGETLASKLERSKTLATDECASVMLPTISAVGTAHALGIVHRDLKPANVFLVHSGSDSSVRLLDFGIARVLGESHDTTQLTTTGALLGTPAYMSPEQLFGEPFDHRADIWALGVLAFEMLTGAPPTRAENIGQVLRIVGGPTNWRARDVVPTVPEPISEIVARMLSREPEKRPSDLREVLEVFSRYASFSSPSFGPPLSRRSELDRDESVPAASDSGG